MHLIVDWIRLVEGVVVLALTVTILALRFSDRLHRALALWLVLFGMRQVLRNIEPESEFTFALISLSTYLRLAAPFALAYLGACYLDRFGRTGLRRVATPIILILALAVLTVHAVDHDAFYTHPVLGASMGETNPGWLHGSWTAIWLFLPNVIASVLVHDALRADPARRRSLLLLALGFAFGTSAYSLHLFVPELMFPLDYELWIASASLLPLLWSALALLAASRRGDADLAADANRFVAVLAVVPVSIVGLWAAESYLLVGEGHRIGMISTMVFWEVGGVAIITYAVLRMHVFGIETGAHLIVRRGAVAAVFVAAFFVLSQMAEVLAEQAASGFGDLSWVVGSGGAGLLLFTLRPLERWANRVATVAVPEGRATPGYAQSRGLQVYEAAVRASLDDGKVQANERRMLDRLRQQLSLKPDDARAIERDVLGA